MSIREVAIWAVRCIVRALPGEGIPILACLAGVHAATEQVGNPDLHELVGIRAGVHAELIVVVAVFGEGAAGSAGPGFRVAVLPVLADLHTLRISAENLLEETCRTVRNTDLESIVGIPCCAVLSTYRVSASVLQLQVPS